MKWMDAVIIAVLAALFVLSMYQSLFDQSPTQIADSYCQANGYGPNANFKFTKNTFFVNCTSQEYCASDQECIRKNGAMKE